MNCRASAKVIGALTHATRDNGVRLASFNEFRRGTPFDEQWRRIPGFQAQLAEYVATAVKKGSHVLIDGNFFSSDYERPSQLAEKLRFIELVRSEFLIRERGTTKVGRFF